jgi:hypothetical protein
MGRAQTAARLKASRVRGRGVEVIGVS